MMERVYAAAEQLIARHLDLHGALNEVRRTFSFCPVHLHGTHLHCTSIAAVRKACDTNNGKQLMTSKVHVLR